MAAVILLNINPVSAPDILAKEKPKLWQTEKQLLKAAKGSLRKLEKAIRRDKFASAVCALNIWRSNAQDAGIFDQARYNDYKKRIYRKSIGNIFYWFDISIEEGWIKEAKFWRRAYYFRSTAINAFDQARYDKMKKKIQEKTTISK